MSRQTWTKRDPIKNYFPLPNEIYSLGLSPGAVVVYGYLMRQEDRKTYQCLASYRTIGERGLIRTERTTVTTWDGRTRNGCLRYHILPIQMSINQFYEGQLQEAERAVERWKAAERLDQHTKQGGI